MQLSWADAQSYLCASGSPDIAQCRIAQASELRGKLIFSGVCGMRPKLTHRPSIRLPADGGRGDGHILPPALLLKYPFNGDFKTLRIKVFNSICGPALFGSRPRYSDSACMQSDL